MDQSSAVAPVAPPTTPPAPAPLDLDALLDAELPLPPQGAKGHSIDSKKVVEALPEDARKLIANLRDDYRAKTTDISKQRRELESTQAAWLAGQEAKLKEQAGIPDDIDIFSSDGLQKFVEAKVAAAMLEAQQPLRAKLASDTRRVELETFRSAHPDIDNYKSRIVQLLSSGEAQKPEQAYWIARGEGAGAKEQALAGEVVALKAKEAEQARTRLGKFAPGSNPSGDQLGKSKLPTDPYERYLAIKASKG